MNKLLLLALMGPLCLGSTASLSQDTRTLPRWREEAIVKDLIRYDGCRADRDSLISEVTSFKSLVSAHEGKEVILEKIAADMLSQIGDYQKIIQNKNAEITDVKKSKAWLWLIIGIETVALILSLSH